MASLAGGGQIHTHAPRPDAGAPEERTHPCCLSYGADHPLPTPTVTPRELRPLRRRRWRGPAGGAPCFPPGLAGRIFGGGSAVTVT